MYSTCLFCNSSLGANESIEHFPVGRRLAYDGATGRLWVVCKTCARWNLSPLETRWEAIEDAERLFRATKLRASSDNIGLAQLKEGTELVRIGKPLKPEFAAWRYGDQFGKRYRRVWIPLAGSLGLVTGSMALNFTSLQFTGRAGMLGLSTMGVAMLLNAAHTTTGLFGSWKNHRKVRANVRDDDGALLPLTRVDACEVALIPGPHNFDWRLRVARHRVRNTNALSRALGVPERTQYTAEYANLRGEVALRALATILPQVNYTGANRKQVQEAVGVIEDAQNLNYLMHLAATNQESQRDNDYMNDGGSTLSKIPGSLRLALEMSIHTDDERRAMEGELAELEARWRDADAIARIADELLLPETVQSRIDTQKSRKAEP